jgi:hypothetical protein
MDRMVLNLYKFRRLCCYVQVVEDEEGSSWQLYGPEKGSYNTSIANR